MKFEWNDLKAKTNIMKHGVSFEEASSVFFDEEALLRDDPNHSDEEDRFILLGMSELTNVLIVCHCYKESDDVIRIISARKATKNEQNNIMRKGNDMKAEYDFSKAKKNPYAKKLKAEKQQVTMNLNTSTVTYFKNLAAKTNIPYQTLINLFLDECVKEKKTIHFV